MATLQVTPHQFELILSALRVSEKCSERASDQAEDEAIRQATLQIAAQFGQLRRELRDGVLTPAEKMLVDAGEL
jgi:hypothetical protein